MDREGYWLSVVVLGLPAWVFGVFKYFTTSCIPVGFNELCGPTAVGGLIIYSVGIAIWLVTPFIKSKKKR